MSAFISFVLVIIIYSHVDLYLRAARIVNLVPGFWSVFMAVLALLSWIFASRKTRAGNEYSVIEHRRNQRDVLLWAAVFACVALFSYLFSDRTPEVFRALLTLGSTMWMFGIFLVIYRGEREVNAGRAAMIIVVLLSVVNNLVDLSGLYAFSDTDIRGIGFYSNPDGRGAGFYVNPNVSGLYLVLAMVMTVPVVPVRYRFGYCLLVGVGVVATFSRSSVLAWLLCLYGIAHAKYFRLDRRLVAVLLGGMASLILAMQFSGAIVQTLGLEAYLSENALERIHYDASADKSVQGRLAVARRSWELIKKSPWVGHGLGSASVGATAVQSHNMFLLIGVEMGLLGILIYCGLYVLLWRLGSDVARIFVVALFVGSLFSHDILDNSSMWLAFALLSGVSSSRKGAHDGGDPKSYRGRRARAHIVPAEPWRMVARPEYRP